MVIVQLYFSAAISTLTDDSLCRSAYDHMVSEIKSLMDSRVFSHCKIHSNQNRVTHCLENVGRIEANMACWLGQGPSVSKTW